MKNIIILSLVFFLTGCMFKQSLPAYYMKLKPDYKKYIQEKDINDLKDDQKKSLSSRIIKILDRRLEPLLGRGYMCKIEEDGSIMVLLSEQRDYSRIRALVTRQNKLGLYEVDEDAVEATEGQNEPGGYWYDIKLKKGWMVLSNELRNEEREIVRRIPVVVSQTPSLTGEHIIDAEVSLTEYGGYAVNFELSDDGALLFTQATKANIDEQIAIVLDDKVLSTPVVKSPIYGGRGQITGNFSHEEAKDLAIALQSPLPASLILIEEGAIGK